MSIEELLDMIEERPVMYITEPTISCLKAFIDGWMLEQITSESYDFINDFQSWIANKFNITSGQSWAQIILFYSPDQNFALKQAFDYFQEFRDGRK